MVKLDAVAAGLEIGNIKGPQRQRLLLEEVLKEHFDVRVVVATSADGLVVGESDDAGPVVVDRSHRDNNVRPIENLPVVFVVRRERACARVVVVIKIDAERPVACRDHTPAQKGAVNGWALGPSAVATAVDHRRDEGPNQGHSHPSGRHPNQNRHDEEREGVEAAYFCSREGSDTGEVQVQEELAGDLYVPRVSVGSHNHLVSAWVRQ